MQRPVDPAAMGQAMRNYFGQGPNMGRLPTMGPPAPAQPTPGMRPAYQQPGPVSFEDALKALGPAMNNGQIYTNPQAYQGYQNAARAVGAMYGMQPAGYFNNARPEAFQPMPGMPYRSADDQRYGQRPFDQQFRQQFAGAPNSSMAGPTPNR